MTLELSKNLSGIGALLIVIGSLGAFGTAFAGVLGLVGLVLLLIGLKGVADHYNEAGIFNNALYGVIFTIVGIVAFIGAMVASILMAIAGLTDLEVGDLSNLGTILQDRFADMNTLWSFLAAVIVALVVLFVFVVIAVLFFRKSMNLLASKTGVTLFGTAGLLMLIGAVLTIVAVGLILIWVAWILVTVAFFSIRAQAHSPPPPPPPPA
jgi:uncharacterized membrane protein